MEAPPNKSIAPIASLNALLIRQAITMRETILAPIYRPMPSCEARARIVTTSETMMKLINVSMIRLINWRT